MFVLRDRLPAVPPERPRHVPHAGADGMTAVDTDAEPSGAAAGRAPADTAAPRPDRGRRPGEPVGRPARPRRLRASPLVPCWPDILGDPTRTRQWAEYLCYAMVAVGIDIAWGYGGMLALGQGVFFGLGRLLPWACTCRSSRSSPGELPQFMSLYSDYDRRCRWLWRPFEHLWFAVAAAVLVPMLVAGAARAGSCSGAASGARTSPSSPRRRRSIFWLHPRRPAPAHGRHQRPHQLQHGLRAQQVRAGAPTGSSTAWPRSALLVVLVLIGRQLVRSRFGRLLVATRDGEDRVRFLGYDPALDQDGRRSSSRRAWPGSPGRWRRRSSASSPPTSSRVLPSILIVALGRRRRPGHAVRARCSAPCS